MGRVFGTDGVRGEANRVLTPELAFKLGRCAAEVLKDQKGEKGFFLIGKDTRISGDMLESALAAGICSAGSDVWLAGVVPTPAVAYLSRCYNADAGVVISASHNPAMDNGIKFFNGNGYKLSDETENHIEELLEKDFHEIPPGDEVGRVRILKNAGDEYRTFLKESFPLDLSRLKIAVDCANGAASFLMPVLLRELNAEVFSFGDDPDGLNINRDCGSTHMNYIREKVLETGADIGIAHDGDADRVLLVDRKGRIFDGDRIILLLAKALKREGRLEGNSVVITVMSNLGLRRALDDEDIDFSETQVGDRYVLERMLKENLVVGGEQSGHVIMTDYNTTGDGMLTALAVLKEIVDGGRELDEMHGDMTDCPQKLVNVVLRNRADKDRWRSDEEIAGLISDSEKQMGENGRVLVRASGTEPLVRVMVESFDEEMTDRTAAKIAGAIRDKFGVKE